MLFLYILNRECLTGVPQQPGTFGILVGPQSPALGVLAQTRAVSNTRIRDAYILVYKFSLPVFSRAWPSPDLGLRAKCHGWLCMWEAEDKAEDKINDDNAVPYVSYKRLP